MASRRRAVYPAWVSVFPSPSRKSYSLLALLLLLLASGRADAKTKYLIESGWDEPDPAFMRKHIAQMEAAPFDGCVYHVGGDRGGRDLGNTGAFTWQVFGRRTFREAELARDIADLRATQFVRFRHNFLRVNVTPGNVDWFDDYGPILSNLTLAASIARRAGSTGILLDTETYEGRIFSYPDQKSRGQKRFALYSAQARKRGTEVMRALEAGYPGLTVFLTLAAAHADIQRRGDHIAFERGNYGLLPPFVDGLVLGASSAARIVDGMEAAYPVREASAVDSYFAAQEEADFLFTDPEKYRRVVSRSLGVWLDFDWRHRVWSDTEIRKNYRSPESLRATLRRALEKADDYVWLYAETPKWWTAKGGRAKLPEAYVQAVRDARKGLTP
jgi:hypothetical protein